MKTMNTFRSRCSLFTGGIHSTVPIKALTLQQLHNRITSDRYKAQTENIRVLPNKSDQQKEQKIQLDFITPTGEFTKRGADGLAVRSGLLVLDFDNFPNPAGLRKAIRRDKRLGPSVQVAFVSPTGMGLKVFVAVDPTIDHEQNYASIKAYLARERRFWFRYLDTPGKDVARACFLCHDPNAYLNPHHQAPVPFTTVAGLADMFDESKSPFPSSGSTINDITRIEAWVAAVEEAGTFPDDYDSWFRTAFAFATLREEGRSFFHRISQLSPKYQKRQCDKQFSLAVKGATGKITLGTFVYYCQKAGIEVTVAPHTASGPSIPDALYSQFPDLLQRICQPFEDREKDVMLLGTLGVLSGCFPGVSGIYDGRRYGLNLFCFVVAPAASGKGVMAWAKRLAQPWHRYMLEQNKLSIAQYKADMAAYDANRRSGFPPMEPPRLLLYLPADATGAALIDALQENSGWGIIFGTEADTLTTALGGEHGKFADKLCAMFQHEGISFIRKVNKQHVEIEHPAISIVLSGTPAQVPRLMPSAENGLVSRFLFYCFQQAHVWRSVAPKGGPSLDDYFDAVADELFNFIQQTQSADKDGPLEVEITLSVADWARLDEAGADGLADAVNAVGDPGASTAFRLGQVAFRLIGLLTVLRCFENEQVPVGQVQADAADVTTALELIKIFRAHALAVLANLSKSSKRSPSLSSVRAEKQVEALRLRGLGMSMGRIALQLDLPKSTVQRWLEQR